MIDINDFKDIKGFEGKYGVSKDGRVFSYHVNRELPLRPTTTSDYLYARLYEHNHCHQYSVHRLVASTYIPNPNNLPEVDHIDRNIRNNHVDNLRWVSRLDNLMNTECQMVRNVRKCTLWYKGNFIRVFKSVASACRFAEKQYGMSRTSMDKYRKVKDCEIKSVTTSQYWCKVDVSNHLKCEVSKCFERAYGNEIVYSSRKLGVKRIDTDVSTIHRGEIIEFVRERYGNICKIMTIGYTKNPEKHEIGKSAVQRAGQALNLDPQKLRRLVKGIQLDMNEVLVSGEFDRTTLEQIYDVAQHFSYRLDKISMHASAILVTPDDIENYTPVEGCNSTDVSTGERKYTRAAAYTYHQLEAMGCLKLDILGLGTLDVIDECLKSIGITMDDIPMDDKATYKTYADGHLMGVFQMESSGMTRTAQQLGVSNFNDIAALVALFRPGPIYSGMLQQYIDGKHGKEVVYPCKELKEIAGKTYGVLVYQEQIMKIAMAMAGYDLGQADGLRKVIGRKEVTKVDQAVTDFVSACVARGHDESVAKDVGEQIRAAGSYVFNLAHSVEYAQMSYKSAYLKTHYPVEYMCALINSKSKQEDVLKYIPELNRLGIKILPPDYQIGNLRWQVEGKAIRVGLHYLKGVGKALRGGCKTWEQFITRNNKTISTALIKAGAMDFLGQTRGWMLANLESHAEKLAYMEKCKERIAFYTEQGKDKMREQWEVKLKNTVILSESGNGYDEAKGETEILGFTFKTIPKILVGVAESVQEFNDKNGKLMARVVFNTDYGSYTCVVFASQWKQKDHRGRYGLVKGVFVEKNKSYEFIQKDGIIQECREIV